MSIFRIKYLLNVMTCGILLSLPLEAASAAPPKTQPAETKQSWKAFTSTESGFSIDLPTKPEYVEQTIDIPKSDLKIAYETFLSEPSDNVVYVVSVWHYPAQIDMSKPEVNLQDGFGGMLSALPGSEVLNMRMTEVGGFKALEFLVKNEDIYFQGKLILVHNTLYQVFTVYKKSEDMSKDYTHFIESFKLINPEKRKTSPQNGNGSSKKNGNGQINIPKHKMNV